MITFDYSKALKFIDEKRFFTIQDIVNDCHEMLHNGTGPGSEFLGWVSQPSDYNLDEIAKIKTASDRIKSQSEAFVVIGIGGSYLGAKAAIGMLNSHFYNELPNAKRNSPKIYFSGFNISPTYLKELLDVIDDKDISINVISKSGTTLETILAFSVLKEHIEGKYGRDGAKKRIYVTTDKEKGPLKALADGQGYETFAIPDDIAGRYSVLTPVGLLPMAVSGIDIEKVLEGAKDAGTALASQNISENPSYQYGAIRNILYENGKFIEIMVNYEPRLFYFGEWYKQLFGESEGKDGKGIFPVTMNFTTDLHSMGQYIQEGRKHIFETILNVLKPKAEMSIGNSCVSDLAPLEGKTFDYINKKAYEGTINAHLAGDVPNLIINIPEISPYYFGYLVYFFMKTCGMSAYLLGVNPFDQPGVELYKRNMYKLLDL